MIKMTENKCDCRWVLKKSICLIVLAVLVWLNGTYRWIGWDKFAAIVIGIVGLKMLVLAACCKCRKK